MGKPPILTAGLITFVTSGIEDAGEQISELVFGEARAGILALALVLVSAPPATTD